MSDITHKTRVDAQGNTRAGFCDIISIQIENYAGDIRDLKVVAHTIRITESLMVPGLTLEIAIQDAINFFEEFELRGQEKIRIHLRQQFNKRDAKLARKTDIELEFFVTDFSEFVRGTDNQKQAYKMVGVTEQMFLSSLKKISRPLRANTADEIRNIFVDDLRLPPEKFVIHGDTSTKYKGVLNWDTPLSHAMNLRDKLLDGNNTPYFLYQTISGNVYLSPLSYLIDGETNPTYSKYVDRPFSEATEGLPEKEYETMIKMKSVSSQMGLSHLENAMSGAYAGRYNYIDIFHKSHAIENFNSLSTQTKDKYRITQVGNINEDFKVSVDKTSTQLSLNEIPLASLNYSYRNAHGFEDDIARTGLNSGDINEKTRKLHRSYIKSYDSVVQSVELVGDFLLSPGSKIELDFSKAIAMDQYKRVTGKSETQEKDLALSGQYLVFGCVHEITGGEYSISVRAKKDNI